MSYRNDEKQFGILGCVVDKLSAQDIEGNFWKPVFHSDGSLCETRC